MDRTMQAAIDELVSASDDEIVGNTCKLKQSMIDGFWQNVTERLQALFDKTTQTPEALSHETPH